MKRFVILLVTVTVIAALGGYALADGTGYWTRCDQVGHSLACSFFEHTPYRRPGAYFTLTCTLGTAVNGLGAYRYDCRINVHYFGHPALGGK